MTKGQKSKETLSSWVSWTVYQTACRRWWEMDDGTKARRLWWYCFCLNIDAFLQVMENKVMWQVLHAFKTYFRIIPSWQSYDSLSRIYCCPEKVFKVKLDVPIKHQQITDPLSSSTSSSLLGTACAASALLKNFWLEISLKKIKSPCYSSPSFEKHYAEWE